MLAREARRFVSVIASFRDETDGGQFIFTTELIKPHFLVHSPTDAAPQFLKKLTPSYICFFFWQSSNQTTNLVTKDAKKIKRWHVLQTRGYKIQAQKFGNFKDSLTSSRSCKESLMACEVFLSSGGMK